MKTLRQTALNCYEQCPHLFQLNWGEIGETSYAEENELTNKWAQVGLVLHEVMEYWGNDKTDDTTEDVTLTELHNMINKKMDNIDVTLFGDDKKGLMPEDEVEDYKKSLHEQLDWVWESACCESVVPLKTEHRFEHEGLLDGLIKFSGTIDSIQGNFATRQIDLVDWKTGKVYPKRDLASNIQATIYSLAFMREFGFLPVRFIFYFTKHKKVKVIYITPDFIQKGVERILNIWYNIKEGNFKPYTANKFFCNNFCERQSDCVVFKNKQMYGNNWDNIK